MQCFAYRRRGGPKCPPVVGASDWLHVGNKGKMSKNIPFFRKPRWYAFAPDGEYRHVFPPGGHMGPPLRRDTEVAWDIYKGKGLAVRWCEIFVGNGLGHSACRAVSQSKGFRLSQILPSVRRGGPNANRLRGSGKIAKNDG